MLCETEMSLFGVLTAQFDSSKTARILFSFELNEDSLSLAIVGCFWAI